MKPELEAIATAEMMLLCSVARLEMDEASLGLMDRALDRGIDWERLRPLAEFHGLRPLLNRHLGPSDDRRVPGSVSEMMRRDAHAIAAGNLDMTRELVDVVECLDAAGVECVSFKGPVLAQAVYGSRALREFGDLDIAVRPTDLGRGLDALGRVGFRSTTTLGRRADRVVHRASGAVPLRRHGPGTTVELHWRLMPRYRPGLTLDDVWERRERAVVLNRSVACLAPADRFVMLAVHGGKHAWGSLGWVVDVAEAARAGSSMRPEVAERAAAGRVTRSVELASSLARDLLGTGFESPVSEIVADLGRDLGERLVKEAAAPYPPSSLAGHRFFLDMRDTTRQRAAYLGALVFAPMPADGAAFRLPDRLAFLYPLVRPLRLLARACAGMIPRAESRPRAGNRVPKAA